MTSASPWGPAPGRPDPPVQRLARAVTMAFLVVGVLGFLPGATSHLSQTAVAGPGSPAVLLGLLPVTAAGNLAHVLLGLAGLVPLWFAAAGVVLVGAAWLASPTPRATDCPAPRFPGQGDGVGRRHPSSSRRKDQR